MATAPMVLNHPRVSCGVYMMTWTVDIVEVGRIPDLPLNLYLPDAQPEARLDVPCYCYLLTGPEGCVLVDTGPDRVASAQAGLVIEGDPSSSLIRALRYR